MKDKITPFIRRSARKMFDSLKKETRKHSSEGDVDDRAASVIASPLVSSISDVTNPSDMALRLCIVHVNSPGVMGRITSAIGDSGFNITEHVMKTNGDRGYQIVDVQAQMDSWLAVQAKFRVRSKSTKIGKLLKKLHSMPDVESCEVGRFGPGVQLMNNPLPSRRLCIVNDNVVGILGKISVALGNKGINIIEEINKSHGPLAYNIVAIEDKSDLEIESLRSLVLDIDGVHSCDIDDFSPGTLAAISATSAKQEAIQRSESRGCLNEGGLTRAESFLLKESLIEKKIVQIEDVDVPLQATEREASGDYYGGSKDEVGRSNFSLMRERDRMTQDSAKLVLAMVGLPARGKSFIARKLAKFLRWKHYNTEIFNAGRYRRSAVAPEESGVSDFYSASNEQAKLMREQAANSAMTDMLQFLTCEGGDVAIFDATNSTNERRKKIIDRCDGYARVVFVEVICDDKEILEENILVKVRTSPDFKGLDLNEALKDMKCRIQNYEAVYEPLSDDSMAYIKLYNLSSKILANKVYGRITKSILPYMLALHVGGRPIWITRAGLAEGSKFTEASRDPSTKSKVAPLSKEGKEFAKNLVEWIRTALWTSAGGDEPDLPALQVYQRGSHADSARSVATSDPQNKQKPRAHSRRQTVRLGDGRAETSARLKVMASTLPRAEETIADLDVLDGRKEKITMLNPLDKGTFVGQSMDTIKHEHPAFFAEWSRNPFHMRFPGGESYYDLMVRLESVIVEMEQQTAPVLLISHISCIQVLLAYFLDKPITEAMNIDVPMHSVIELTPVLGGSWKEKVHNLAGLM